jgi:hypothetical protein
MKTNPYNEHLLWKGKIQLANYPIPKLKKDMIGLTKINSLTGTIIHGQPCIYDELYQKTLNESQAYWKGFEERKKLYRNTKIN